jgi:hypothetical protein
MRRISAKRGRFLDSKMRVLIRTTALVGAAMIALPSNSAAAATYHIVGADNDSMMMVDIGSIQKVVPYVRVWTTFIWSGYQADNVYAKRFLSELDCGGRRSRTLSATSYDANLSNPMSKTGVSEWSYIAPDTWGDQELSMICDGAYGKDTILEGGLQNIMRSYRQVAAEKKLED